MRIDPAKINAYPWNTRAKLCPLLDDPALWAHALDEKQRRAVKTAAKKLGRKEVISITDDQKIGEHCCWLLQKFHSRKILAHILERDGNSFVHQGLWNEFYQENQEVTAAFPKISFTIERNERIYLVPEAFSKRLREVMPKGDVLRSVAILGTAFAILQPDEASEILEVLLEYDPTLEKLLLISTAEENIVPESQVTAERERDELQPKGEHIDGSNGLASNGPKQERALTLTRPWIQAGLRTMQLFLEAHSTLMRQVAALQDGATNLDLSKEHPLEDDAGFLTKAAESMHKAAAEVDSWFDEWFNPLQMGLSSAPEILREPLGRLFEEFRAPRSRAQEMRKVCENVCEVILKLSDLHTRAITANQGLRQKILTILTDLGRSDAVFDDATLGDDLIRIELSNICLDQEKTRLGTERASLVNSRRVICQAKLKQIDPTSRKQDEASHAEMNKLSEQVEGVSTLADLSAIEGRIQLLSDQWPRLIPKQSLEELAAEAIEKEAELAYLLMIVKELIATKMPVEAAFLLELIQEVYEPEAVEIELPEFFDALLLCWSSLAPLLERRLQLLSDENNACDSECTTQQLPQRWLTLANEFRDNWFLYALSGKWVARMNKGDMTDSEMVRRIAGAFLGIHAMGSSQSVMGLFYSLGINDFEFNRKNPNICHLHAEVKAQRAFALSDGTMEKKIADAKRELTEFFRQHKNGDYMRQIAQGNTVAEAERTALFPELRQLVNSLVRDAETGRWNGDIAGFLTRINNAAQDAFRKYGLKTADSPYYQKKIFGPDGYLVALGERVQLFLLAQSEYTQRVGKLSKPTDLTTLNEELDEIAAEDPVFAGFWASVRATLNRSVFGEVPVSRQKMGGVSLLLNLFPEAMQLAPRLLLRLTSQEESLEPTLEDLREIFKEIADSNASANEVWIQNAGCLLHSLVSAVSRSASSVVEKVREAYTAELESLERQYTDISSRCPSNTKLKLVREAISNGRWPLAKKIFQTIEDEVNQSQEKSRGDARKTLQSYNARIALCLQELEKCGADLTADRLIELGAAASARISSVIRKSQMEVPHKDEVIIASQLVDAIEFSLRNRRSSFSEIESLLGVSTPPQLEAENHPRDAERFPWGDGRVEAPWSFLAKQRQLNADSRRESARQWGDLVRAFCRLSEMYHDPRESLTSTSIPGCHFMRYKSAFYSPRSAWLDRPIHLFLLLKTDDWQDQWSRLTAILGEESGALSIVIVPTGIQELRDRFKVGRPEDPFVLVGEEEVRQVSNASVPGAPLRQLLHRGAARLTDVGLFCTDGAVHSRKNLFVGRESALNRLEIEKTSGVWGGRRIGKTSLLHALKERLTNPKRREPFRVGYVYADPLHGDPDLALSRRIAESLGMSIPNTVADLATLLTAACKQQRVAVLVDEVDRYIEASRASHGDSTFPLARVLRGVSSQNPDTFKVVYAGFKQLYYEVNIRPMPDNAYPFKNFITPLREDFGDLDADKVEELLRIAFEDMLGITLEPSVARLVKEKTSGHPAFVQEFGRQLLEIVERRRRTSKNLRITKSDVEAVYQESPDGTGGHSSYIDYVYETLNWNLSCLGKAIMLAISSDIVAHGHRSDRNYRRDEIPTILERWSTQGLPRPQEEDFANALKFLVMTNMLLRHLDGNHEGYSVAYPSYIDFMVKLGDRDKIRVYESLRGYNENEIGKIV